ncbi:MAG: hypothetical protein ACE5GW_13495 [Planctomycetota bacterium]
MPSRRPSPALAIVLAATLGLLAGCGLLADSKPRHGDTGDKETPTAVDPRPLPYHMARCPVSDEEILKEDAVVYVHAGRAYHFCCEHCVNVFKRNPGKWLN